LTPGLALARGYYADVVAPLAADVPHAAALLGWGSDVLGFDTERSTDHGWGPRLQVFVAKEDVGRLSAAVERALPEEYGGYSTSFGWGDVPVMQYVQVTELAPWLEGRLGFDPGDGIDVIDWLLTPQQLLLSVTAGAVFHDSSGELGRIRSVLEWYPRDIWLWLLACQWRRIEQEESFPGRAAEVHDELGSRIVAARLSRDLMRLAFLLERRYAPYGKWLGSAFAGLDAAAVAAPALGRLLAAATWPDREQAFVEAAEAVARMHNAAGITEPVDATARPYHGRPFQVIGAGRFVEACLAEVGDARLRALPLIGSVDQVVDSADVLSYAPRLRGLAGLYGGL
jgi:hypothetical protein